MAIHESFLREILRGAAKAHCAKVFSPKIVFFTNWRKFSLSNFFVHIKQSQMLPSEIVKRLRVINPWSFLVDYNCTHPVSGSGNINFASLKVGVSTSIAITSASFREPDKTTSYLQR